MLQGTSYKHSSLLGCYAILTGSKRWQLFTGRHSVTSQNSWIFVSAAVISKNLASCKMQRLISSFLFHSLLTGYFFFIVNYLKLATLYLTCDIIVFMKRRLGLLPSPRTGSVRPINLIDYKPNVFMWNVQSSRMINGSRKSWLLSSAWYSHLVLASELKIQIRKRIFRSCQISEFPYIEWRFQSFRVGDATIDGYSWTLSPFSGSK
jgi:hypothetical protein